MIGSASNYYIGGNDEHGVNPPTTGKRTPIMPYINRSFYENEFNRAAKDFFLAACVRCGFSVFDVKPEYRDISIPVRVARINAQNLTLLVTFAYNAFGSGLTFNAPAGFEVFYSPTNVRATASRLLSYDISQGLQQTITARNRGVTALPGAGVLSSVNCISSLIEAGFMTNFADAKKMLDPDFARAVGEGAALGVCNYLGVPYVAALNPADMPVLRRGSNSLYVKYLQLLLNTYGYSLTADGAFGAQTEAAVKDFQQKNSLSADGIVGYQTWSALMRTQSPLPVLRRGSTGRYVRYLQLKLLSKLYDPGPADGIFGAQTERALRQFQQENSLSPDGVAGPLTWAKLAPIGGGRPLT